MLPNPLARPVAALISPEKYGESEVDEFRSERVSTRCRLDTEFEKPRKALMP